MVLELSGRLAWRWQREVPVTRAGASSMEIKPEDITDHRRIAEGSFGVVYAAQWLQAPVAMKRLRPPGSGLSATEVEAVIADYRREVLHLKDLRHPNVLSFFGAPGPAPARAAMAAC